MKLGEVVEQVGLSRRAIKFYEEQGLFEVKRDRNGYRNYTEQDILLLKEISAYRKLGISLSDIKILLNEKDSSFLHKLLQEKEQDLQSHKNEVAALRAWIRTQDAEAFCQAVDYQTAAQAIQDAIPGFYGYYFLHHFLPYLQIKIESPAQKEAYQKILDFWDNTTIRIPLLLRFSGWLSFHFCSEAAKRTSIRQMDAVIQQYQNPTDAEYEQLKQQVFSHFQQKKHVFSPLWGIGFAQRKLTKELQDKGYYDIFLPNLAILSPPYREYQEALNRLNSRICRDLGLYYDSHYHLVQKKGS